MSAEWTKEKGPDCFCGALTWVEPGEPAMLVCIFHSRDAGACFPLPKERPEKWPDLTRDELHACMVKGANEEEARDGGK
jgi:hypothetical protein